MTVISLSIQTPHHICRHFRGCPIIMVTMELPKLTLKFPKYLPVSDKSFFSCSCMAQLLCLRLTVVVSVCFHIFSSFSLIPYSFFSYQACLLSIALQYQ